MPEKYALQKQAHVRLIKLANAAAVIRRTRRQVKQASGDAQPNWLSKSKDFMRDNPGYSAAIGASIAGLLGTMTNGVSGGLVGAGLGGLAGWGGSKYLQKSTTPLPEGDMEPPELEQEDPYAMVGADMVDLRYIRDPRDFSDVPNRTDLSNVGAIEDYFRPSPSPGMIDAYQFDTTYFDPTYLENPNPPFTVPQGQPLGVTPAFAPGSVAMVKEGPNPYPYLNEGLTVLNSPFVNSSASIQVPDTINY